MDHHAISQGQFITCLMLQVFIDGCELSIRVRQSHNVEKTSLTSTPPPEKFLMLEEEQTQNQGGHSGMTGMTGIAWV